MILDREKDNFFEKAQNMKISFGKYKHILDIINFNNNNIINKIIQLAMDIGPDPCGRYFNVEKLISFAIEQKITQMDIDYIYRYYVYNIMAKVEGLSIDEIALREIESEFCIYYE